MSREFDRLQRNGEGIREPRGIPAVRLLFHDKEEVSTIYFERSSCHCDFPCQSRKGSSFDEFKFRNFAQRRRQSRFEIRAVSDQCYASCLKPREQGESTYRYQAKPEKVDAKSHKHSVIHMHPLPPRRLWITLPAELTPELVDHAFCFRIQGLSFCITWETLQEVILFLFRICCRWTPSARLPWPTGSLWGAAVVS